MSGALRKELTLARSRLQKAVDKVSDRPSVIIDIRGKTPTDAEEELKTIADQITDDQALLKANIRGVQEIEARWDDIVAGIKGTTEKEAEEALKKTWEESTAPPITEAADKLDELAIQAAKVQQARTDLRNPPNPPKNPGTPSAGASSTATTTSASSASSSFTPPPPPVYTAPPATTTTAAAVTTSLASSGLIPPTPATTMHASSSLTPTTVVTTNAATAATTATSPILDEEPRLPQQQLPHFSGERTKWRQFKELFEVSIHNRHIPNIRKLQFLLNCLQGEAAALVEGFPLEGSSYDAVWSTLSREYGDDTVLRLRLHSDLRHLAPSDESVESTSKLIREAKRLCRLLSQLGEDVSNTQTTAIIEEKLPGWLLKQAVRRRKSEPGWTTDRLFEYLEDEVGTQRAIEEVERVYKKSAKKAFVAAAPHVATNHQFPRQEDKWQRNPKRQTPSQSKHPPRKDERRQKTCLFCQETGHFPSGCPKFPNPQARRQKLKDMGRCSRCCSGRHTDEAACRERINCSFCKERNHSTIVCELGPGGKMASKPKPTTVMTAAIQKPEPKQKLLMTKMATLSNPDDSSQRRAALVFLDSGSEESFIANRTAEALQLPVERREQLVISTLNNSSQHVETSVYRVNVQKTSGSHIAVEAYGVDKVTEKLTALTNEEELMKPYPESTEEEPELLLGGEALTAIFPQAELLPSGLVALDSVLGKVAFGTIRVATAQVKAEEPRELFEKLYDLEGVGIKDDCPSQDDDEIALQHFREHVDATRMEDTTPSGPTRTRIQS